MFMLSLSLLLLLLLLLLIKTLYLVAAINTFIFYSIRRQLMCVDMIMCKAINVCRHDHVYRVLVSCDSSIVTDMVM